MCAWSSVGRCVGAVLVAVAVPVAVAAQAAAVPPAPSARISLADAVRLALDHNHQLRAQRLNVDLMTALVACIGLLPAAMSTGIGSDSQNPFAIVIVGGLVSRLALSIFLAPVVYALVARDDDVLKV
jgi:Cu/Ag efflux pump CusA